MTEADARRLAEIRVCEADFQRWMGPDGWAGQLQLDRRFLLRLLDEALAAAQQWRPIETAPENESVLIYIPNCEHYGAGVYRGMLINMGTGRHWSANAVAMGRDLGGDLLPTHWMPLPESPK